MRDSEAVGLVPQLLSIGHSNGSFEDFVRLLESHGVEVVVDVRTSPRSRYVPHFDADALRAALLDRGTKYVYLGKELGGRPDGPEFYDAEDHVLYDRLAESSDFRAGLERLLSGARQFRVAMMCSEEDPLHCHRRLLIGRVLTGLGVAVGHIRGNGQIQTEDILSAREAREERQQPLFSTPSEDRPWRSIRSVSRRRMRLTSSEH